MIRKIIKIDEENAMAVDFVLRRVTREPLKW